MSANNEILITELPSRFELCNVDVDNPNQGFVIGKAKSLRRAIKIANDYLNENEVEYGLRVRLFK
jgi:hypothetical protein